MDEERTLVTKAEGTPLRHLLHHLHLCFSFLFLFISYSSMQNLVSTIVPGNTGYWSLATIYILCCLSSLLIGPSVVSFIKPKMSFIIGCFCYCSFIIANLWPMDATLLPTAALLGLGAGVLWTAQGTYVTAVASNYALKKGQARKSAMGLFTGIFFGIFQMTQIIGNLIAGFILSPYQTAGKPLPKESLQILTYTYIIIAGISFVSFFFLAPEETPEEGPKEEKTVLQKIFRAILLLKDKRLVLLLPIFLYSGMEQAFIYGNFTKDLVAETIGPAKIGFVMTVFGASDVIFSFLLGKFSDTRGAAPLIVFGFLSQFFFFTGYFIMFVYTDYAWLTKNGWILYISAGIYGIGDAAWNTFCNTVLSIFFINDAESAFANFKFVQALGSVLPFAVGGYLTLQVKLISLLGFLFFGVICLIYLQIFVASLPRKDKIINVIDPKKKNINS